MRGFRLLAEQRVRAVTSNHVLDETITLLGRRAGRDFAAERGRAWIASDALQILRPDSGQELAALVEFERFAGQALSFTDCLSFVLMRENGVQEVFGFDTGFRLGGFSLWPANE